MSKKIDFSKPIAVQDSEVVIGSPYVEGRLLPDRKDIPDEFERDYNVWHKFISEWFFLGLEEGYKIVPKEGIDLNLAMRHIVAVMKSFQPKHEHKEGGLAYLCSMWFESVDYKARKFKMPGRE